MKSEITLNEFKKILFSHKWSIVFMWIFYFILSNIGDTPHDNLTLFIISGLFSLGLHMFISVVILIFRKYNI